MTRTFCTAKYLGSVIEIVHFVFTASVSWFYVNNMSLNIEKHLYSFLIKVQNAEGM